jgi:hypothetical protein
MTGRKEFEQQQKLLTDAPCEMFEFNLLDLEL